VASGRQLSAFQLETLWRWDRERKSGKIYHVPGSDAYDKMRIDESKGERWFCTEEEAKAEGWRAPKS
jgi:hypothetical protein